MGRGWAHRAVGAIGHVTGVEGEDGSPGAHVENALVVLQQQGAVVEAAPTEAPDTREFCKGNRGTDAGPRGRQVASHQEKTEDGATSGWEVIQRGYRADGARCQQLQQEERERGGLVGGEKH